MIVLAAACSETQAERQIPCHRPLECCKLGVRTATPESVPFPRSLAMCLCRQPGVEQFRDV
jgi:hypothetical protein